MAKEQPKPLEPLEEATVYYIKQIEKFPCEGQWAIYSKTKYGDKWFNIYRSKEVAITAAKTHELNLKLD